MDNKLIYNRIKELVDKQGITANKLLLDCKINSSFLNDLKSKNVNPSIEKILKISQYFNVSIDYLVTGKTNFLNDISDLQLPEEQMLFKIYHSLDEKKQHIILQKALELSNEDS